MRTRNMIITAAVLASLAMALTSYDGYAADKTVVAKASPRIGVVNLRTIFQKNKLNEDFDAKLEQEKNKTMAEVEAITKKIEDMKAEMKTRTVGSNDYMGLMSQVLEQQGMLQAKKEFFQQSMEARQQRFTEDLYMKAKEAIADYAAKNGYDLVLVKDEIQFPAASPNDLMLALSTRKVLYSSPELDITDAILEAVNASAGAAK